MRLSKSFILGILVSFFLGFILLAATSWLSEDYLPKAACGGQLELPKEISYDRVGAKFWLVACQPRHLLVGSSELTGEYSVPFFFRQSGYLFDQFIGAHRGIKTLGFLSGHSLSQERVANLKILAFINPIYFTPGPAVMQAPMVYRSASSVFVMNKIVPNGGMGASESFAQTPFVLAKSMVSDMLQFFARSFFKMEMPSLRDYSPSIPAEYDIEKGLLKKYENLVFSSDVQLNIQPTMSFAQSVAENKNQLQICLVLLPLNERFLNSQSEKYKKQIPDFYSQYRNFFHNVDTLDLTGMGTEPYLFADTMHFTEYGAKMIVDKVVLSRCFRGVWGSGL